MNSPGSPSSWLMTAFTDTARPGTTAAACAFTSAVSCSRSPRRKGRISTGMPTPPGRPASRFGGRHRCGTGPRLPGDAPRRGDATLRGLTPRCCAALLRELPAGRSAPRLRRRAAALLVQAARADRALHLLRLLAVPASVLELDRRVEGLPGARDHRRPLLAARPRSRHDLVGHPLVVERLLHPPARVPRYLRPEVLAAMQPHGHGPSQLVGASLLRAGLEREQVVDG